MSTKSLGKKLLHSIACLICMAISLKMTAGLEGTEFSGGTITGPLLSMADIGIVLFTLSLLFGFWSARIAHSLSAIASLLCLPLALLDFAPGPFRRVVGGLWSVPLTSNYVVNAWTAGWLIVLLAMLFFSGVSILWHFKRTLTLPKAVT